MRIDNQHLFSILYLLEEHLSICQTSGSHCLGGWWHVSASQHGTIVEHLCHCVQLCHIDNTQTETQTQEHTYTQNMNATVCHCAIQRTHKHRNIQAQENITSWADCRAPVPLCTTVPYREHTNTNTRAYKHRQIWLCLLKHKQWRHAARSL